MFSDDETSLLKKYIMANWCLAISCFVVNLCVLGTVRLSAIYYVECIASYGASRHDASLPFTLQAILKQLSGPLIGIFAKLLGLKETTTIGCVLVGIGIGLCFFAENIIHIIICWGLIFGLGCGFSTALLPAILNEFYAEDKTKANGFALSGGSFGSLIFPPIVLLILAHYGTSGSFLILSAALCNFFPAVMLLKNPKISEKTTLIKSDEKTYGAHEKSLKTECKGSLPKIKTSIFILNSVKKDEMCKDSGIVNEAFNLSKENTSREQKTKTLSLRCDLERNCKDYIRSDFIELKEIKAVTSDGPSNESIIFNQTYNIFSTEDLKREGTASVQEQNTKHHSIFKTLNVFLNPTFILISSAQSMFIYGKSIFFTILLDYMRDKGMQKSTDVYFLTSSALFDMFGRLCLGFITDNLYMTRTNYTALCFLLFGLSLLMLALFSSFTLMMIAVCSWGILHGGLSSVFPANISDYISKEQKTMAMSCRMIFAAPLHLTTPFLIDYFRGKLGSYDGIVIILSVFCFISTILTLLTPCVAKKQLSKMDI